MREKEDVRITLEEINKEYPHMLLNVSEIAKITGITRERVPATFGKYMEVYGKRKYINKCTLARLMCKGISK